MYTSVCYASSSWTHLTYEGTDIGKPLSRVSDTLGEEAEHTLTWCQCALTGTCTIFAQCKQHTPHCMKYEALVVQNPRRLMLFLGDIV